MSRTAGVGKVYSKGKGKGWGFYFRHKERTYRRFDKSWDKNTAMEEKRKLESELGAGYDNRRAKEVTFNDLAKLIRDDYAGRGNRSTVSMEARLARLEEFFGKDGLASEIEKRWKLYEENRLKKAKPATVQYELSVLRRMFRLGFENEPRLVEKRLSVTLSVKVDNARQGFFTADEREAVLSHLPEDVRPFIEFLALTAWRSGEAKWLTWKTVEFKAGEVTLPPGITKNNKGRTLYFKEHPRLSELLKRQRERAMAAGALKPDMPVFFRVFAGGVRPVKSFRKAWLTACEEAGCEGKLVHDLRRTGVHDMERAGIPRSIAMKLTGHLTEAVYLRYAVGDKDDLRRAMSQLAKTQEMASEVADDVQDASR